MTITRRRIFLEDYAVMVSIGIHDHERRAPQRVLVSVEIELTDAAPPAADRIDAVLDYDFLREEIAGLVQDRHFDLQETLCHEILELIVQRPEVARVRLSTRKPDVYEDCRSVGYAIDYQT